MAINATTFSAAVGLTDTSVSLASLTGITAPNYQTGAGITYLFSEQEIMKVVSLIGTTGANVIRGELGTQAKAHGSSAVVIAGLPADFSGFNPALQTAIPAYPIPFQGFSAPVASATAITATGPYFHVTGTTQITAMTPPAGYVEGGEINIVFDGACSWATGGTAGIAFSASSTSTLTGIMVSFVLDKNTGLWYASHL